MNAGARRLPATVIDNLRDAVQRGPERPLLKAAGTTIGYREFAERVEGAVAQLRAAGVRRGDRVAWCAANRLESAVLIWACARGGFVSVGLPTNLQAGAWRVLIGNARPRLVLADAGLTGRVPGAVSLGSVLSGRRLPWDDAVPAPDPDDVYALVYTSGTTGVPKGVMITHRATMAVAGVYRDLLHLTPSDVTAIHLPFSYVSGHISQLNPMMLGGGTAVVLPAFRPRTLLDTIRAENVTVLDLVPWMFSVLLRHRSFDPRALPSLRAVIFGGAPMPPDLLAAVRDRFPHLELFDVYGMSETAGMIGIRDATDPARTGAAPAAGVQVRRAGDGELLVRGPVVTPGYWANPDASTRLLRDGWLRTGDRADLDPAGDIHVHGRVVDMINRGGVKIAPEDVEHALLSHPAVRDAAAYGIPDGDAGQAVAAAVVIVPGTAVDPGALRSWLRAWLPAHARPRSIDVVAEIPRNPTGKVDRAALRRRHERAAS